MATTIDATTHHRCPYRPGEEGEERTDTYLLDERRVETLYPVGRRAPGQVHVGVGVGVGAGRLVRGRGRGGAAGRTVRQHTYRRMTTQLHNNATDILPIQT